MQNMKWALVMEFIVHWKFPKANYQQFENLCTRTTTKWPKLSKEQDSEEVYKAKNVCDAQKQD